MAPHLLNYWPITEVWQGKYKLQWTYFPQQTGTSFKSIMRQKMWWNEPDKMLSRRSSTHTLTKLDSAAEDSQAQVLLNLCTAVPNDPRSIVLHHFLPSTAQMWAWQSANRAWKNKRIKIYFLCWNEKQPCLMETMSRTNTGPRLVLPSFLRNTFRWHCRSFTVKTKSSE